MSFVMASLVGCPLARKGDAGVVLVSSCLRSSKAAAIRSLEEVDGSGNFLGRKTTVGQNLLLLVDGMYIS